MSPSPSQTGKIDFVVNGETYHTWYAVFGDLKCGITPLVGLHGGPGGRCDYLLSHLDLVELQNRPLVLYDQIGNGKSTHLPNKPKEFWTVELFMDELENVLEFLGIADKYDAVGHSWGAMLLASFIIAERPRARGLRRLVLVSGPASIAKWDEGMEILLRRMPPDVQDAVRRHEAAGTFDHPEYLHAVEVFAERHMCLLRPNPPEWIRTLEGLAEDPTVYSSMWGSSEFTTNGSLKSWSEIENLHKILQPTLMINGAADEAHDVCMRPYFERIPKVKWVTFAHSSHTSFYEEREKYMEVVSTFLGSD